MHPVSPDKFRRALGGPALLVWQTMLDLRDADANDLVPGWHFGRAAAALGLTLNQVTTAMRKLQTCGLAENRASKAHPRWHALGWDEGAKLWVPTRALVYIKRGKAPTYTRERALAYDAEFQQLRQLDAEHHREEALTAVQVLLDLLLEYAGTPLEDVLHEVEEMSWPGVAQLVEWQAQEVGQEVPEPPAPPEPSHPRLRVVQGGR